MGGKNCHGKDNTVMILTEKCRWGVYVCLEIIYIWGLWGEGGLDRRGNLKKPNV